MSKSNGRLWAPVAAIIFLLLTYFEPLQIGALKFSYVWKAAFIAFAFFYLYRPKAQSIRIRKNSVATASIVLAAKSLANDGTISAFGAGLLKFSKLLTFFIFFQFFSAGIRYRKLNPISILNYLAIFTVISFIPFYFGLLNSLGTSYDIGTYGAEEGVSGLVGVFQNAHVCSIALAVALTSILFLIRENLLVWPKFVTWLLFLLGAFFLYKCYVRTGWAMLFFGVAWIYKKNLKSPLGLIKGLLAVLLVMSVAVVLFKTDPVLSHRVQDTTVYEEAAGTSGRLGSGRFSFWLAGGQIALNEMSVQDWLLGLGEPDLIERMYSYTGMHIYTHNRFIDVFLSEGIVGFALYITFLALLLKYILRHKNSVVFDLALGLLIVYVVQQIVQSGDSFYFDVVMALLIAAISECERQNDWALPRQPKLVLCRGVA